ncbi:MAG: hypothetical protein KBG20_01700 [Caldilineaceae bacterium]|nr:hypothetical protein [Caldilineaceae bacterium]MBP8107433.1 hypothetical protein [Caldilineaceae bacterium]MBP8123368.1 hypothetical protein [Caldilineaceae bacterium]MBP9070976.1 hypothetical protein [Caldilineaceae bacterium]
MALTYAQFLYAIARAEPTKPVALPEVTPEELDDLSDALHGSLTFRRFEGQIGEGLRINRAIRLSAKSQAFLNRNIQAFQQRLSRGEIRIVKGPGGTKIVAGAEGDKTEALGTKSNPCTWYWKLKHYWWGVRLGLNHCAVEWLSSGASAAAAAVAAFGISSWISAILVVAASVLKAFDRGCGVRLYITWAGVWWVGPRPKNSDHC